MKLYVLVRKDLSKSQQAVQAGHAVAEWLLRNPDSQEWTNGTLVYLIVHNEQELFEWTDKLDGLGVSWTGFREPDIGNQMTAMATLGNDRLYSQLPLL